MSDSRSVLGVGLDAENFPSYRQVVTHHAEDGSGVGSAIIAGKLLALRLLDDVANARASHDQDSQGQGHLRRRLRDLGVAFGRGNARQSQNCILIHRRRRSRRTEGVSRRS